MKSGIETELTGQETKGMDPLPEEGTSNQELSKQILPACTAKLSLAHCLF